MQEVLKKGIVNKAIGMCGKQKNAHKSCTLFRKETDAIRYMGAFCRKGRIYKIADGVWLVHDESEASQLKNGFIPIREQVLGMARLQLFRLCNDLQHDGCELLAIKTDAIYYLEPKSPRPEAEQRRHKWETNTIGGVRLKRDVKSMPQKAWQYHDRSDFMAEFMGSLASDAAARIPTTTSSSLPPDGKVVNKTFMTGQGGAGKSYTLFHALVKDHGKGKILGVAPDH